MHVEPRRALRLAVLAIVVAWWAATTGLVSSNDGSHVALARALALRGETTIDPDVALTLFVDRAVREGHAYSDRPPGTAVAAVPAVWLGALADDPLARQSLARRQFVVTPAAPPFAETHAVRVARHAPDARPLLGLQGTALAIGLHAVLVGALALLCVDALLRRRAVAPSARLFAISALGVSTAWGAYSTVLFSHVTSGTLLVAMALALERATDAGVRARTLDLAAGLCGAWAIASDYLLIVLVVPWVVLHAAPRRWPAIALGALPIVAAIAAYHHAAFGSPLAIGYDFHANFEFARSRGATFDGNPLAGMWILLGLGRGAGVLALSPVVLAGAAALAFGRERRWLAAISPWFVSLSLHHTPWGGATMDHRYLVPVLPFVGVGLGIAWQRLLDRSDARGRAGRFLLVALALGSALLVWSHFFAWRDG